MNKDFKDPTLTFMIDTALSLSDSPIGLSSTIHRHIIKPKKKIND